MPIKKIDPVSRLGDVFDVESLNSFVMPTKLIYACILLLLLLTITLKCFDIANSELLTSLVLNRVLFLLLRALV